MSASGHPRPCPICGKPKIYAADPVGPFCSGRCRMVDLGNWFGEDYRISEPLRPDHFAEYEELSIPGEIERPSDE